MIKNISKWKGKFDIFINGKHAKTLYNIITDVALDEMIEILMGTASDIQIKYLAVGDDDTAVTGVETALGNETFRTAIASQTKTAVGTVTSDFTILNTEAVGSIEEIGIFGGAAATAAADSGTLIARLLWSKTKTNLEEISIVRTDEISRS